MAEFDFLYPTKKNKMIVYGIAGAVAILAIAFVIYIVNYYRKTEPFQLVDQESVDSEVQESFSNPDTETLGLSNGEVGIVKVSATWCGHCKAMQEDWDKLYAEYNNKEVNGKTTKIITIDENNPIQETFMSQHNIDGFPTILKVEMTENGLSSPVVNDSGRSYSDLVSFIA